MSYGPWYSKTLPCVSLARTVQQITTRFQDTSSSPLLLLPLHSVVPTALLIMERKDFYLMARPSLRCSDPTFRKRRGEKIKGFFREKKTLFQLVSTEAHGEHLCWRRLLLDKSQLSPVPRPNSTTDTAGDPTLVVTKFSRQKK